MIHPVLAIVAFILAGIELVRSKWMSLLAWAVLALSLVPAVAFFRSIL